MTRSPRFKTLRLVPTEPEFLRLLCWDMILKGLGVKKGAKNSSPKPGRKGFVRLGPNRAVRPYPSTFFRTISVTIFGFAFPWLAFIACPVNQFIAFSLPA